MSETTGDAYDRGVIAGEIAARLAGHDKHFASINGSLATLASEMHDLVLAVQRLGDQAEANAKTVITTAAALKSAEEARRDKIEHSWSPVAKVLAVLAGVVGVVALVVAFMAVK
jgi:hypothetical protein